MLVYDREGGAAAAGPTGEVLEFTSLVDVAREDNEIFRKSGFDLFDCADDARGVARAPSQITNAYSFASRSVSIPYQVNP